MVRKYSPIAEIKCPRCNSEDYIKDGRVRNKQRYLCKNCNHHYTLSGKRTDKSLKRKALILYMEGFGLRTIGRLLNVSHVSVQNWVKQCGEELKMVRNKNKPEIITSHEIKNYIGPDKIKHLGMISGWLLIGVGKDLMITFWLEDKE